MRVTSVVGHLKEFAFPLQCKNWQNFDMKQLYEIDLLEQLIEGSNGQIGRNLIKEAKNVNEVQIWTDCDREGEAIGFDIA